MSARRIRPAIAATLVALAVAPLTAGAGGGAPTGDDLLACDTKGQITKVDGWARISAPRYAPGEGDATIASFAAPLDLRGRVYVTNGRVVQASVTGGCKWDHVYRATTTSNENAAPDTAPPVIAQLVAPAGASLWMTTYDNVGGVPRPHVLATADATPVGGNTTKAGVGSVDLGLPSAGRPLDLQVASTNAERAYLLVEQPPNPASGDLSTWPRHVYRTIVDDTLEAADIKQVRWEDLTLPAGFGQVQGLRVSPAQSNTIWIWSGKNYAVSKDGGVTWAAKTARGPISQLDVDVTDSAAIYTREADGVALTVTNSAFLVLDERSVPIDPVAATHGSRSGVFAVAGAKETYGFDTRLDGWTPIHPTGAPAFSRLTVSSGGPYGRILLGQTPDALYRFDLWAQERFLPPPTGVGGGKAVDPGVLPTGIRSPVLEVEKYEVTVAPGDIAPDDVDFGIGPSPTPVDVFFLMDTTLSMSAAITGLKDGVKKIAHQLADRTHGQACYGVGDVKDFNAVGTGGTSSITPYKLVMPITCGDDLGPLERAVDQLKEGGGDSVEAEAQTIALTQAVKGKDQLNPFVAPGQDAKFVSPTRVIVLITDAGFKQGGGFPTIPVTVQTLNAYHHTHVLGVVVLDNNNAALATRDVTEVVRGTDTLAPEQGVDCDNDGNVDIAPNDPLVCQTENVAPNIAPAITGLLLGLKDPGTLALKVDDPHKVVKRVHSPLSGLFNLKHENHLLNTLDLTCSQSQDGKDLPLRLVGAARDTDVRDVEVVVHCRAPKEIVIPPVPPRRIPPREPEQFDPPPAPRPLVAPVIAPQFQPPPAQNPISNANPNAGFSQQDEQQFQVAGVTQGAADEQQDQEETELAMSGLGSDDAAARAVLGCAMLLTAGGALTVAARRRTQRAQRYAYVVPRR